ncbi:MAG: tRNA (guanosine(37)-N1)-methyltransferase TrmD [Candidatus Paceibacterota bacterium]
MRFHIITIFPDIFDSYLNESIIGRAIKNKLISVKFYNPRDFIKAQKNNYKPVDDKPYGGGPGMVMRAEPILKAVDFVFKKLKAKSSKLKAVLVINFIPSAEKFTTNYAKNISKKYTDIILICGRYEGIDARVDKILRQAQDKFLKFKLLSIGDYVLTGGEIPAMILVDCVSRQIEGVLGNYDSREEERISSSEVYTRPEVIKYRPSKAIKNLYKNYKACPVGSTLSFGVPKVLLSGNHKNIEEWKKRK